MIMFYVSDGLLEDTTAMETSVVIAKHVNFKTSGH